MTKFSRYNESSDSEESDTSESSSDDDEAVDHQPVHLMDDTHAGDTADDDTAMTSDDSVTVDLSKNSESVEHTADAEMSAVTSHTDTPACDTTASQKAEVLVSSVDGRSPSPVQSPLREPSSPLKSRYYNDTNREDETSGTKYRQQSRSRSRSVSVGKFPDGINKRAVSPCRQRSRSGSSHSRLSSRHSSEKATSLSRGRGETSPVVPSSFHPRSRSPVARSLELQNSRSRSAERRPLPVPHQNKLHTSRRLVARSRSGSRSSDDQSLSHRRTARQLSPNRPEKQKPNGSRLQEARHDSQRSVVKRKYKTSRRLPQVRDSLSPLSSGERKVPSSSRRSRRRSLDDVPSARVSPLSQSQRVHDMTDGSPKRPNEAARSYARKRYSPLPVDSAPAETIRAHLRTSDGRQYDKQTRKLPATFRTKAESGVHSFREDKPPSLDRNKRRRRDLSSKPLRVSADESGDSAVAERLKKLAEPEEPVRGNAEIKSARSAHVEQSPSLDAEDSKKRSVAAKTKKVGTREAVTIKQPVDRTSAVLEARKRRFLQTKDLDSRSVCMRPSSEAETGHSAAKVSRQLSPLSGSSSSQPDRDSVAMAKPAVGTKSKTSSGVEARRKNRMGFSDISEPSAESSVSLEDISDDETLPSQEKNIGEKSSLKLGSLSKGGREYAQRRQKHGSNSDDDMDTKATTVSSVVKSVKKHSEPPKVPDAIERDVDNGDHRTTDDADMSDAGVVVKAPSRNVVSKGLSCVLCVLVLNKQGIKPESY